MKNELDTTLQWFESMQIRTSWDEEAEKWWFSALDIVAALTDQTDYARNRNYWKWLKNKLKQEGSEVVSVTNQLKLKAPDGKMRLTDILDINQVFRIIQSIPSKKAEPFKLWLAELSTKEISDVVNPQSFSEHEDVAKRGGGVAKEAKLKLEAETGQCAKRQAIAVIKQRQKE